MASCRPGLGSAKPSEPALLRAWPVAALLLLLAEASSFCEAQLFDLPPIAVPQGHTCLDQYDVQDVPVRPPFVTTMGSPGCARRGAVRAKGKGGG